MERRICHFSGYVQGVGFRYTTRNLALQYDVNGYVKNLPDGRVELVLEGSNTEMDELIDGIKRKLNGHIRQLQMNVAPATGEFNEFYIRH